MSVRNGVVLSLALSTLIFLIGCGSSGPGITRGQCPPIGCFSTSNLKGTYVFSASGTDLVTGASYAIVGTIDANGSGGITGGTVDMNDQSFTGPFLNAQINNNSVYNLGPDGRGTATIGVNGNPFGHNLTFDFVLQDDFHGLIIEFDGNATGSGTLDLQTLPTQASLAGSWAFSLSGANSAGFPFATVGAFTIDGNGNITTGSEDYNSNGIASLNEPFNAGSAVILGPSSSPATVLSTPAFALTFDAFAIDSTHLKLIETDSASNLLSGDAFTETSTAFPTGTLAFTLAGFYPAPTSLSANPYAAGGFFTVSGTTLNGTEDNNNGGSPSVSPEAFSAGFSNSGSLVQGRYVLSLSSFLGGGQYVAYPSSGGLLLMEADTNATTPTPGIMSGAAIAQSSTAFSSSQGYALNFTGANVASGQFAEVDDIAEFSASASGASCSAGGNTYSSDTLIGVADENSTNDGTILGQRLCGQYGTIDSNGRYGILALANTESGGYVLTAYSTDGFTFPFIESDSNGQISAGVMVEQNASATSPFAAKTHNMFVTHPLVRPRAAVAKQKQK